MANGFSYVNYTGDGSKRDFAIPFQYLDKAHISVKVNGSAAAFTWVNDSTVRLSVAPAAGAAVYISRVTPKAAPMVDFVDGATLTEDDLDLAVKQLLYVSQDSYEQYLDTAAKVQTESDRTLKFPESTPSTTLPAATNRSNRFLTFDAAGLPRMSDATVGQIEGVTVASWLDGKSAGDVDGYVGDGVRVRFPTGHNLLSKSTVLVIVGGVKQPPGAYTIDGQDVVLSEAPPSGVLVDIRVNGVPVAVADASGALVTVPGTTTPRTLEQRFAAEYAPEDFGAAGDGTADDTAAFVAASAALAASGGGTIRLSRGKRYRILSNLTLGRNVSIVGCFEHPGEQQNPFQYMGANALPGAILLSGTATITTGQNSAILRTAILRDGLISPPPDAATAQAQIAAFAGKAITLNGSDNKLEDLLIIGFEHAVYKDSAINTIERFRLRNLLIDCTNGVHLTHIFDNGYMENVHCWPAYDTHTSLSYTGKGHRSGVAFYLADHADGASLIDCFSYGYDGGGVVVVDCPFVRVTNHYTDCGANTTAVGYSWTGNCYTGVMVNCGSFNGSTAVALDLTDGQTFSLLGGTFQGITASGLTLNGGIVSCNGAQFLAASGRNPSLITWPASAGGALILDGCVFVNTNNTFGAVDPANLPALQLIGCSFSFANDSLGNRLNNNLTLLNNKSFRLADANGNPAYLICQSDNNLVFYGTNAAGGARAIWNIPQNSSTSAFNVSVPLTTGSTATFGGTASAPTVLANSTTTPSIGGITYRMGAFGTGSNHVLSARYSADGGSPFFSLAKSRATAVGQNAVVQAGDVLGGLAAYGDNGSGFSPAGEVQFISSGTPGAASMGADWLLKTTSDGAAATTGRLRVTQAATRPETDNAFTLGTAGARWSTVYAATGTINTSDAREKDIEGDCPLGLSFIQALRPVAYRWKVGSNTVTLEPDGVDEDGNPKFREVVSSRPGSRTHTGLLAQEVKAALPDGFDWAGWTLDDPTDPESRQGLRPDQLIAPLIKAVQELAARVATLETAAK